MRWILALALTTGCSALYDFGVFEGVDEGGRGDGGTDGDGSAIGDRDAGPPPPDADLSMLELTFIEPEAVHEGTGCAFAGGECAPGSRGAVVVVHGGNISQSASVTLEGFQFAGPTEVASQVSRDGELIAFAIPIAVDPDLDEGQEASISVTVTQGGFTQSTELRVVGLDELVAGGTVDAGTLRPLYSTIDVASTLNLTGTVPARFVATATIEVDALINARGGTVRRAGGCLGGIAATAGNCAPRGGGAGGVASGGGGGGNIAVGSVGAGASPGGSGGASPAVMLTPLAAVAGHGGGGGGTNAIGLGGQTGGGGGGVVELSAGTRLTIGTAGVIDVHGATGGDSGGCLANLGGGAGGGGSGGGILLRAQTLSLAGSAGVQLQITGGPGGVGNVGCSGGAGASGQARYDAQLVTDPQNELAVATARGAMWPANTPVIARGPGPASLPLVGVPGYPYHLKVNTEPAEPIELAATTDFVDAPLVPGLNLVCALVVADGSIAVPESGNCLHVAFLP